MITCGYGSCKEQCPSRNGLCSRHWAMVPYDVQRETWQSRDLAKAIQEVELRDPSFIQMLRLEVVECQTSSEARV